MLAAFDQRPQPTRVSQRATGRAVGHDLQRGGLAGAQVDERVVARLQVPRTKEVPQRASVVVDQHGIDQHVVDQHVVDRGVVDHGQERPDGRESKDRTLSTRRKAVLVG